MSVHHKKEFPKCSHTDFFLFCFYFLVIFCFIFCFTSALKDLNIFVVWDGLNRNHFSVFRIVNETSNEDCLVPGIDQLYSTNSWDGVHKVVQLGPKHKFA